MSTGQYVSNEAEELLTAAGLRTIDDAFRIGDPLSGIRTLKGSRHTHKEVVTETVGRAGSSFQIYIKRQWRRERFLPRWTDIRRGGMSSPVAEWRGLMHIRAAGILAAEPLALFRRSRISTHSAIVTLAVPAKHSLNEMLDLGLVRSLPAGAAYYLVQAIVQTIGQLQSAGFGWRSMKAKHLYPEPTGECTWCIWLIDCEGIYPNASLHDQTKDRARFISSLHKTEEDHGLYSALCARLLNTLPETESVVLSPQKRVWRRGLVQLPLARS